MWADQILRDGSGTGRARITWRACLACLSYRCTKSLVTEGAKWTVSGDRVASNTVRSLPRQECNVSGDDGTRMALTIGQGLAYVEDEA